MLKWLTSPQSAAVADIATMPNHRQFTQAGGMRRRFLLRPAITLIVLDLVLMSASIAGFIFAIRDRLGFVGLADTLTAIACLVLASETLAYGTGAYRHDSFLDFSTATTRLAVGLGVAVIFLVPVFHFGWATVYGAPAFLSVTRSLTIVLIGAGAGLCSGMVSRLLFMAMARRQWFGRTILIIGSGKRARYLRDILARADRRLTQVYFLTESYLGGTAPAKVAGQVVDGLPAASSPDDLATTLHVDQVVLAVDDTTGLRFDHLLPWKATGIPVLDFNTFLERETGRVDITWTEPDWLLYSEGFHYGYLDRALKRLLDIGVSASLLLLTFPALVMVAIAIAVDDFGPIFYRQERVSFAGSRFWIIKFRTMRVDAEANGAVWASHNDPRTTRIGRILRRTRIDEIPQLINVLRGDMSLVGPRPERPVFVDDLSREIGLYHLRHSVKAGLTGWAQINYPYGASTEDAARKLEYDLYYLKHFSLVRDIAIMLQTLRILLFAKGGR
jgi:sugar transferase (PEP-CTERM system associated)